MEKQPIFGDSSPEKEYIDWCAAQVKLMRGALRRNNDTELVEEVFRNVAKKEGQKAAEDMHFQLITEQDGLTPKGKHNNN